MEQANPKDFSRDFSRDLLRWYDRGHRSLPWRYEGKQPKVYHVWLSEMMLQQTQVKTVLPYFKKFVSQWPSLSALARADLNDVLSAWAGLGYYSRVRSLHRTARLIKQDYKGRFPKEESELKKLPGIGVYTAAAISVFAFGKSAVIVDGNIKRVMARVFRLRFEDDKGIKTAAQRLTPKHRTSDYAQALMDLGATLCLPRKPNCKQCVLSKYCQAHRRGQADQFGIRKKAKPKPHREGKAFVITDKTGRVFLVRRQPRGLLGGMTCFPSSGWDDQEHKLQLQLKWTKQKEKVFHVFTHFTLSLSIYHASVSTLQSAKLSALDGAKWVEPKQTTKEALPSLMRKVWQSYEANRSSRARIS